jgi:hypothetical protein
MEDGKGSKVLLLVSEHNHVLLVLVPAHVKV